MLILGIDPGARETGVAVVDFGDRRAGPRLVISTTVRSTAPTAVYLPVPADYLAAIVETIGPIVNALPRVDGVAVEDVVAPNLHMERAAYSTGPIVATAQVSGWCLGLLAEHWPLAIRVPPHGNGGAPLGAYPPQLVSDTERRNPNWRIRPGGDKAKLRHERSAYDVARVGHRLHTSTTRPTLR